MTRRTFSQTRIAWGVPMVLGVGAVFLGGLFYRANHRPLPANIVVEARALSVDPLQLDEIVQIETKLFAKKPLTQAEWERYRTYATGSNLVFKRKLARHLCAAQGSTFEQEALSLVKNLLSDSDPQTRACALISLRKFADPTWRDVAKRFLSDPADAPRQMGAAMLQDGHQL